MSMSDVIHGKLKELNKLRHRIEGENIDEAKRITEVWISEYLASLKRVLRKEKREERVSLRISLDVDEELSMDDHFEIQDKVKEIEGVQKAFVHRYNHEELIEAVQENLQNDYQGDNSE